MNNTVKSGPIHFYVTTDRMSDIATIVEYCVQIGERQPLLRSQAAHLVCDGQVTVDDQKVTNLGVSLPHGTWRLGVRGKNHHLIVHGAIKE